LSQHYEFLYHPLKPLFLLLNVISQASGKLYYQCLCPIYKINIKLHVANRIIRTEYVRTTSKVDIIQIQKNFAEFKSDVLRGCDGVIQYIFLDIISD
jgi:hypothetical protein